MNELFFKTLGVSIKEARQRRGYTQQQLADRMNVSRSCIANWEKGTRVINVVDVLTLCDILNVKASELTEKAEKYLFR